MWANTRGIWWLKARTTCAWTFHEFLEGINIVQKRAAKITRRLVHRFLFLPKIERAANMQH